MSLIMCSPLAVVLSGGLEGPAMSSMRGYAYGWKKEKKKQKIKVMA